MEEFHPVTVFKGVDSIGTAAGALSILHGLGSRFDGLSFLKDMGPKDSSAQAVDAGMKFAAEFATFCLCNGIPGDGVGDFVSSFVNNAKEDKMRLTAWLAFDCVLPLGPDALAKIIGAVEGFADDHMVQYPRQGSWTIAFLTGQPSGEVARYLPGDFVSGYVPTTPNPTSGLFLLMPRPPIANRRGIHGRALR